MIFCTILAAVELGSLASGFIIAILYTVVKPTTSIIWNGPVGKFEMKEYSNGTKELCEIIKNKDNTIIGGGDTASAVINLGYKDAFTHISTGGGASLEMLEGKILPGIDIIEEIWKK